MTSTSKSNTHIAAAEVCIGAALDKPDTHISAISQKIPSLRLWPAAYMTLWQTITQMHDEGKVITPETVAAAASCDVDRLHKWRAYAKVKPVTDAEVDAHAQIVVELGKAVQVKAIGLRLMKDDEQKPVATRLEEAKQELEALNTLTLEERAPTAAALGADLEAELNKAVDTALLVPTGLGRLDEWTWEFRRQKVTVLGAAYKQRKTTLLRNIVLAAASRGSGVSVGMLESDRRSFVADCVAMIADQLLAENVIPGGVEDKLCGEWLLNTRAWKYKGHVYKAIQRALDIWKGLPITVYDRDDVGYSPDPWMLRAKWRRDVLTRGVKLCAVDYAQLLNFGAGMTSFDQAEASADWAKAVAHDLKVHLVVLGQLNEEGVSGSTSYSPKVKGGGALPAAGDQMLKTEYDAEDTPKRLTVRLKLARNSRMGQKEQFVIRPASGLITELEYGKQAVSVIAGDVLHGSAQIDMTVLAAD